MRGSSKPDRQLLDAATFFRHLVGERTVPAEHRHEVLPGREVRDLFFSERGRSSVPAEEVASDMVVQALEGLSDRETVEKLRTSITWKACGIAIDDEGFHPTVLVLWRNTLRGSDNPRGSSKPCARSSTSLAC